MTFLYLAITTVCLSLLNILKKQYNTKSKAPNGFLFSALTALFSCAFFLVRSGFVLHFEIGVLPYSLGFAASFAASVLGSFFAIQYGALSITQLVTSYSLMIPTLYGIVFLGDQIKILTVFGFAAVLISVFLISGQGGSARITPKAAAFLLLAFVGNGMCSTVQKMQQLAFHGAYKNEFMVFALAICFFINFIPALFTKKARLAETKIAFLPGALAGICNGAVNLLVMVLTALMPTAILFPSISAGGIAIGFLVSVFVYKERLTKRQYVGYSLGILSVILLNL